MKQAQALIIEIMGVRGKPLPCLCLIDAQESPALRPWDECAKDYPDEVVKIIGKNFDVYGRIGNILKVI